MEISYERGSARCTRCGLMYEQSNPLQQQCVLHTGIYDNNNGNIVRTWSCCRSTEESSKGCTVQNGHVRCESTARALAAFPTFDGPVQAHDAPKAEDEGSSTAKAKSDAAVPEDANRYTCVVGDTLASVALKHGMQVAHLKKCNRVLSSNLYPGQTLRVMAPQPLTPAEARAAALQKIMTRLHCTEPEAAYFLDEYGDGLHVDRALAEGAIHGYGEKGDDGRMAVAEVTGSQLTGIHRRKVSRV